MRRTSNHPLRPVVAFALMMLVGLGGATFGSRAAAFDQHLQPTAVTDSASPATTSSLPPVRVDALDPAQWSVSSLTVAPGQQILVTNRGVKPHTFAVAEWGIDVSLPTLQTVTITVPTSASPGQSFAFYCSVGNDRTDGQAGTIYIVSPDDEPAAATATTSDNSTKAAPSNQANLTVGDDFMFRPSRLNVTPGQFIEITNTGVLEHHFVVDEWNVNVTVSPGTTALVQVPNGVSPGQGFVFYCSVPGHRDKGEQGTVRIVAPTANGPHTNTQNRGQNFDRFIPEASLISPEWRQVRTGNARAIVPELSNLNVKIFPGEGRGAAYTGPNGSRAAIVVLPFAASSAPSNQIDDAVSAVQAAMMTTWDTSGQSSARYASVPNPPGCDVVNRVGGVTDLYTLPAGSTACELLGTGIVIFVVVEGEVGSVSSVEASDLIVERLLQHAVAFQQ